MVLEQELLRLAQAADLLVGRLDLGVDLIERRCRRPVVDLARRDLLRLRSRVTDMSAECACQLRGGEALEAAALTCSSSRMPRRMRARSSHLRTSSTKLRLLSITPALSCDVGGQR